MSNSRRLVSSTLYDPVEDDYYYDHYDSNPNSSHNSSYMDLSSDYPLFDSSTSTIYPTSGNTLVNPQRRVGRRSPRNQQNRSISPKYPEEYQTVVVRPNNTRAPVRYNYADSVEDDEPEQTILYNETTLITKGRDGTRIKKNTTKTHEYYVKNSDYY